MTTRRSNFLSSRVFWAIAVVFCAIEGAILAFAYERNVDQLELSDQVAVVRESTTVVWRLAASTTALPGAGFPDNPTIADPQFVWLSSALQSLRTGGEIRGLDGTPFHLVSIEAADTRHILTDAIVRWSSFLRLHTHSPGSSVAYEELRALGPSLAGLGVHLAERRDEASRAAMRLVMVALGTSMLAFVVVGTLLIRQTRRFERSGQLMRSMMNQIGAGVCILGSTDKIADANRAACRMLGRPRRELRGKRLDDILQENDGVWTGERPDGMPLAIERIPGMIDSERGPLRIVTLLDVTARHLTNECLQHLANHDPLTGLPNRGFLEGYFTREVARSRAQGLILGVAVVDLDGFKPVNDTYGHAVGDELLVQIAQRFTSALRVSDLIARTGGDEFVGIFPDVGNRESLSFLGERLRGVFDHPFQIKGHTITLTGSIGLAIAPDDGEDQDSLLRAADGAMYRAKQAGRRRAPLAAVGGAGRAA